MDLIRLIINAPNQELKKTLSYLGCQKPALNYFKTEIILLILYEPDRTK